MINSDYYVYVYIDPRNYEEFYYGKGRGSRSKAHLSDEAISAKTDRLKAIEAEGLEPIVRTVCSKLTEAEALLVETALIWKLGRTLTNKVAGNYSKHFRPPNSLHRQIPGFDFNYGIYYFNIGEGEHRNWDDCRKFGFVSSGQGRQWRDQIRRLRKGDVLVGYLKGHGYVGVGKVVAEAVPYREFFHGGKSLSHYTLVADHMSENSHDLEKSEYVAGVRWVKSFPRSSAQWKTKSGLFTSQLVRASLNIQPKTIQFIETSFGVDLRKLADA